MARVLIIAYTTFIHDGRVKRHAEALAARGDTVDVISLRSGHDGLQHGVNVIGIPIDRYRGASRAGYLKQLSALFHRGRRLGLPAGPRQPVRCGNNLHPARCRRAQRAAGALASEAA